MSPRVRVIRFARVTATSDNLGGLEAVASICLDEQPAAAGWIVRSAAGWSHLLGDGVASGLSSQRSRQDLERQIVLFHLGELPATAGAPVRPDVSWIAEAI